MLRLAATFCKMEQPDVGVFLNSSSVLRISLNSYSFNKFVRLLKSPSCRKYFLLTLATLVKKSRRRFLYHPIYCCVYCMHIITARSHVDKYNILAHTASSKSIFHAFLFGFWWPLSAVMNYILAYLLTYFVYAHQNTVAKLLIFIYIVDLI